MWNVLLRVLICSNVYQIQYNGVSTAKQTKVHPVCYCTTENIRVWWAKCGLEVPWRSRKPTTGQAEIHSTVQGQSLNFSSGPDTVLYMQTVYNVILSWDWTMILRCIGTQRCLWGWGNINWPWQINRHCECLRWESNRWCQLWSHTDCHVKLKFILDIIPIISCHHVLVNVISSAFYQVPGFH